MTPLVPTRRCPRRPLLRVELQDFKQYLENRGRALAETPEFLVFYALPFVPEPEHHPSFKGLFAPRWSSDLRQRLDRFLQITIKPQGLPRLLTKWMGSNFDPKTHKSK